MATNSLRPGLDGIRSNPILEPIWRGPLVPVALAASAGVVLDRALSLPFVWSFIAGVLFVFTCIILSQRSKPFTAVALLCFSVASLGSAYHHWQREVYARDDIGEFATEELRPVLLRGIVDTEPLLIKRTGQDDLRSFPAKDSGRFVLQVSSLKQEYDWQTASGRVQVHIPAPREEIHVGDEIEVAGRLQTPAPPANPGEFDYASLLRDQRIRAVMTVKDSGDNLVIMREGSGQSPARVFASIRAWGQRVLMNYLPSDCQGVAIALLLGDGAPMTQDDWDKYIRTGVIHVLAISGQHLVILAAFLGAGLRLMHVPLRRAAIVTALVLLAYALLVGGRPPVMRSAAAICAICGGLLARRPLVRANTFALAWLIVLLLNPTDLFTVGCQLSFLSVAALAWGTTGWFQANKDPLAQLAKLSQPMWWQWVKWVGHQIAVSYAVTLLIWVVVAPMVAAKLHVLSLTGLVIGPPTILLTSIALLSGFTLLFSAVICPPLAHVAAWITQWSLTGCEALVTWAADWPGGCWYVPDMPGWWLWTFYFGVLGLLMLPTLRRFSKWCVLALLMSITFALGSGVAPAPTDEFRCTFLAVGHGGCAVLQTPNGRTLLYDVGSLTGPEVVRRHVAPFLWHQGIRRIDEVFLSHADLDHFNGLVGLMDRFAVGQVSCTPTFHQRQTPAAWRTLKELKRRGVGLRVISGGQGLQSGDVEMEVLHPPAIGPEGNENSRSMVLLIRHAGHTILLTGDLEGPGLEQVTSAAAPRVDVLMAPHHGNKAATQAMMQWAQPRVVVSFQGVPRAFTEKGMAAISGPPLLGTWPHGAVSIRSRNESFNVTTYLSKQAWRLD
jgi:competence protein ComEC